MNHLTSGRITLAIENMIAVYVNNTTPQGFKDPEAAIRARVRLDTALDEITQPAVPPAIDKTKTADGYDLIVTTKADTVLWDVNGITGEVLQLIGRHNEQGTFLAHYVRDAGHNYPRVALDVWCLYVKYENALRAALKRLDDTGEDFA